MRTICVRVLNEHGAIIGKFQRHQFPFFMELAILFLYKNLYVNGVNDVIAYNVK